MALKSIDTVPEPYREIFSNYPCFNKVQSDVLDDALFTDKSLVISAPTGSGKTGIFELSIIHYLMSFNKVDEQSFKIIYISPMKALCEERLVDWHKKFSKYGLNFISVTGDSDNVDFQTLLNHNFIITTPEKWDSLTRKWRDNKKFVQVIKLFMIDEVHLLNEPNRGPTLEVIVCRMKTVQSSIKYENTDGINKNHKIRFIALSATVPNIEDVAEWFGTAPNVQFYKFSDDVRPVKLITKVIGYPYKPDYTNFKFEFMLNYKLRYLITEYSNGKPTLIFCSTRKAVEMTANQILSTITISLKAPQAKRLMDISKTIKDTKLRETLNHGVGYHHAGLMPETRKIIENLFRSGDLPILVTTSTLAMGVNLPAHLVIIKSTKYYTSGGLLDYTETNLLQMIGRAGRPQFDTTATALILTTTKDKEKFEKMIAGTQPLESNLHRHLTEHINAEVVLQTINDLDVAMRWLTSTFLYIRAQKHPQHYGLPLGLDRHEIDRRLLEMCQIEINKLIKAGLLIMDQNVVITATLTGTLMAKYYLAFGTIKLFTQMTGHEILKQILCLISKCDEFFDMYLRVDSKKTLNLLNKCKNKQTIRFPLNGTIKTLEMKINCIIQAVLGCLDINNQSIMSETFKVMRNAERISKCLIEYLENRNNAYQALLNTIILTKCLRAKLWENSPYVCMQLTGIGIVAATQLVNAGKTSFNKILKTSPPEIEMILNKKPPMGSKILEEVQHLPTYELKLEKLENKFSLKIILKNNKILERKSTVDANSVMFLLVGDSLNNILLYEKYNLSYMIENPEVERFIELKDSTVEKIEANFISDSWVGFDCTLSYSLKLTNSSMNENKSEIKYIQNFMDMYLKSKKSIKDANGNKQCENNNDIEIECNKNINNSLHNDNKNDEIENNITNEYKHKANIIDVQIIKPSATNSILKNQNKKENESILNYYKITPKKLENTMENIKEIDKIREISDTNSYEIEEVDTENSLITIDEIGNECEEEDKEKPKELNLQERYSYNPKRLSLYTENKENKKLKISNENKTKVSWRSPLIYSPPQKYSPKINFSYTSTKNTQCNNNLSLNLSCGNDSVKKSAKFALTDWQYDEKKANNKNDYSEKSSLLGDIFSRSFIDNLGLTKAQKRDKEKAETFNATIYFSQVCKNKKPDIDRNQYVENTSNILNNNYLRLSSNENNSFLKYNDELPQQQHGINENLSTEISRETPFDRYSQEFDYNHSPKNFNVEIPENNFSHSQNFSRDAANEYRRDFPPGNHRIFPRREENNFPDYIQTPQPSYICPNLNYISFQEPPRNYGYDFVEPSIKNYSQQPIRKPLYEPNTYSMRNHLSNYSLPNVFGRDYAVPDVNREQLLLPERREPINYNNYESNFINSSSGPKNVFHIDEDNRSFRTNYQQSEINSVFSYGSNNYQSLVLDKEPTEEFIEPQQNYYTGDSYIMNKFLSSVPENNGYY